MKKQEYKTFEQEVFASSIEELLRMYNYRLVENSVIMEELKCKIEEITESKQKGCGRYSDDDKEQCGHGWLCAECKHIANKEK